MKVKFLCAIGSMLSFSLVAHADWQLDAGIGLSDFHHSNALTATESEIRPSLQLGAYQYVRKDWRIGTGVEWLVNEVTDWGGSNNLLVWRLTDIDYRLGDNWAANFNAGFARYYREYPSYGYGFGAGVKYRLSDRWILSVETNWCDVDLSTSVPYDKSKSPKDGFAWGSVVLKVLF